MGLVQRKLTKAVEARPGAVPMLYTIWRLLSRPDIAFKVRNGRVVKYHGDVHSRFVDDIEKICAITGYQSGNIFGRRQGCGYGLSIMGPLAKARQRLKNSLTL